MTVSTLRPSSTTSNTGALGGGAGSAHAALSDDSDATYVELEFVGAEAFEVGLGDLTLPAGAVIKSVAVRLRLLTLFSPTPVSVTLNLDPDDPDAATVVTWSSATTVTAVLSQRAYADADVDAATLTVGPPSANGPVRIHEAYVDVTYVEQPVPTVTAPTGTLTVDDTPAVEWTEVLDSSGGAQTHYEVKIFDDATYGGGGFDPDTSTPDIESGILAGSDLAWTPTTILADDTYRAYVRVAQTVNGELHWSDWDYEDFVVDIDRPATPTLTLTPEDDDGRMQIAVTDPGGGDVDTDYFQIQRAVEQLLYRESIVALGPEFWWGGDAATDLSGNAYSVTAQGGVTPGGVASLILGDDAAATDFDGSNDYISTGYGTRRNLCTNPRLATNGTGYAVNGSGGATINTQTRDQDWPSWLSSNNPTLRQIIGDYAYHAKLTGAGGASNPYIPLGTDGQRVAIAAGQHLTSVVYANLLTKGTGNVEVKINWFDSGGGFLGSATGDVVAVGGQTRYKVSALAPANTASADVYVRQDTLNNGEVFEIFLGAAIHEITSAVVTTPDPFFDGSGYVNDSGTWVSDPGGKVGWLGTAHASASDKGCFANGTVRTFVGVATRDTSSTYDALFGQTAGRSFLGSGGQDVTLNVGSSNTVWSSAWPGNGVPVVWALVFDEPNNNASLYINGALVSTQTQSDQWNAATTMFAIASDGGGNLFDGKMQHVCVFERGLTAGEIAELSEIALFAATDWEDIRTILGDGLVDPDDTAYDYEGSNGSTYTYRVRALHEASAGVYSRSGWVADKDDWTSMAVWLKHPLQPALNAHNPDAGTIRSFPSQSRSSGATVHKVHGRSDPIVTRDAARILESGELVVMTEDADQRAAVDALLDSGDVLLLQFPPEADEPDRYIAIIGEHGRTRVADHQWIHERDESIGWQEVAEPAGDLEAWA